MCAAKCVQGVCDAGRTRLWRRDADSKVYSLQLPFKAHQQRLAPPSGPAQVHTLLFSALPPLLTGMSCVHTAVALSWAPGWCFACECEQSPAAYLQSHLASWLAGKSCNNNKDDSLEGHESSSAFVSAGTGWSPGAAPWNGRPPTICTQRVCAAAASYAGMSHFCGSERDVSCPA